MTGYCDTTKPFERPLRIVVISHAFVVSANQNRWKRLAEDERYEVHLLVPKYWESTWFGENGKKTFRTEEAHGRNFHVHPMATTSVSSWGHYLYKSIDGKFKAIKPDLIYVIHEEEVWIHHQIYLYKKLFAPKAKVIFFSMNAMGVPYVNAKNPLKKVVMKLMWKNILRNTDAALVHYPGCLESLRSGGYSKPIYIQTQVGVDETLFAPKENSRIQYRKKTGFEERLVIGYSGRLVVDKGVDDIYDVFVRLTEKYNSIALLLVGDGCLKADIERSVKEKRLDERVCITGFVDQTEVANYMNAMDIFVLGSKTMPHWIDTFPLVTVQAQAVGIPVIASDSGSIPWQLADSAKVFKEGDRGELYNALDDLISDCSLRGVYAINGKNRSLENFCHVGITKNFKKIIGQVMSSEYEFHKENELYTQWKAY